MGSAEKRPERVAAGKKAARTRKWRTVAAKSRHTADWATYMTKWLVARTTVGTKWHLVTFAGPSGGESRGIVDIVAIRKDHKLEAEGLKRGDLFEIILIQVKGGESPWPTKDDIERLRRVARHHRADEVVLAVWKKGRQPVLHRLKHVLRSGYHPKDAWVEASPSELFR